MLTTQAAIMDYPETKFQPRSSLNRVVDIFSLAQPFQFENGTTLDEIEIVYETYGTLNTDASNAILVCHALTGGANVAGDPFYPENILKKSPQLATVNGKMEGWWKSLIGPGKTLDTSKYFIISSNILGSCYGTSGPASLNPKTGKKYGAGFPQVTVRDMVRAQKALLEHLRIDQLAMAIGGSLGGMQVLEWAVMYPDFVQAIVPIATSARHSDWSIGLNHLAREAIKNDPAWNNGNYETQPKKGLSLARKIGMISYRTDINFNEKFKNQRKLEEKSVFEKDNIFQIESYLNYQGEKLVERFDANAFLNISQAMDLHDLARGRGDLNAVLATIKSKALCIGIDSDILYPAHEQQKIADSIPAAEYKEIKSEAGHDAFLIEFEQMENIIRPFLRSLK